MRENFAEGKTDLEPQARVGMALFFFELVDGGAHMLAELWAALGANQFATANAQLEIMDLTKVKRPCAYRMVDASTATVVP